MSANDNLLKGLPGNPALQGDLVVTDTDQTTALFTVTKATGAVAQAGNLAVNTNKFTVAASSGNTTVAGTLGVTGATTAAAISCTTLAASGLITSSVAAGSPILAAAATSDTPVVVFGADAAHNASTAPAGFIEISVGGSSRYIPFWA